MHVEPPPEGQTSPEVPPLDQTIDDFTPSPEDFADDYKDYLKHNKNLIQMEEEDLGWIIKQRGPAKTFFFVLLIAQNFLVFLLVFIALFWGRLQDLQLVFSVLIGATLAETAAIVRFIVQFLFTSIDYKQRLIELKRKKTG